MDTAMVPNPLTEIQDVLHAAQREAENARVDVEWLKKNKAPRARIEEGEQRLMAAVAKVRAAAAKLQGLEQAQQALDRARDRHAELLQSILQGEDELHEHLLAVVKLFLRLQKDQLKIGRVNGTYRESCVTLGQRSQELPGIPSLFMTAQDTFWDFIGRYLLQVRSGRPLHDGKPLADTIYYLTEAARHGAA